MYSLQNFSLSIVSFGKCTVSLTVEEPIVIEAQLYLNPLKKYENNCTENTENPR